MGYTMSALDRAIEKVLGANVATAMRQNNIGRHTMHQMAMQRCFIDQIPEDENTAALRAAALDLRANGAYTASWCDAEPAAESEDEDSPAP